MLTKMKMVLQRPLTMDIGQMLVGKRTMIYQVLLQAEQHICQLASKTVQALHLQTLRLTAQQFQFRSVKRRCEHGCL